MNIEDILRGHGIGVGSGGGGRMVPYRNHVTTGASPTNTVAIGISSFHSEIDTLLVFQNTVYKELGVDYNFSGDGLSITKISGTWDPDTTFYFLVLTPTPSNDAIRTVRLPKWVAIAADNTTHIPIGIPEFDKNTDVLDVLHDNAIWYETDNYTLTGNGPTAAIDLVGFSVATGEKVLFMVWKKVRADIADIQDAITTVRLTNAVVVPNANATHFNVGIPTFNKNIDALDVYFKGQYLMPVDQYTIAGDGVSIDLVGVTTAQNDKVYFVVYKKVLASSVTLQEIMTTVNLTNVVTIAANGTTDINIGIPEYNKDTDLLDVIFEHNFLYPVTDYAINATGSKITKVTPANTGQTVMFRVWKKVRTDFPKFSGTSVLAFDSITNRHLHPDVKVGSLAALKTLAKDSAIAAINELSDLLQPKTTNYTYTGGQLTGVAVQDSGVTIRSVALNYTGNLLTSVVETIGGKTVTTTLNYTGSNLTSITRVVS